MKRNYYYKKNNGTKTTRKNAFWTETKNGIKYLVSYTTIVASIDTDGNFHRFWNDYSVTTMNHINRFCELFGIRGYSKADWNKLTVEKVDYNDYLSVRPLIIPVKTTYY